MVGPFIFVDQMGPEILARGRGLDVAPHPHIGLATVTYLFKGELMHRDSLGTVQPIRPGEVNWMTAGSGIAHSERTPPDRRQTGSEIFGVQSWVALPDGYEEVDPAFLHYDSPELPVIEEDGFAIRLIAGSLYGLASPVKTYSEMFYIDVELAAGAGMSLPSEQQERAAFIVEGAIALPTEGASFATGELVVFRPKAEVDLRALEGQARMLIFGGEPVGKRHIWWNFVSSSKDRIEQAKLDWSDGKFATVAGETEYIPLPVDERHAIVRYP
jgi:redox-sensitive bicupin YhaK (pirin superfamily)